MRFLSFRKISSTDMVLNEQELVCPNFINLSMHEIKKRIIWAIGLQLLDNSSALGCRTEHGTVYIYKN